jgi:hypothetical protein
MAGEFDEGNGLRAPLRKRVRRRDARGIGEVIDEKDPLPAPEGVEPEEDEETWDEIAAREMREMYAELAPRRRAGAGACSGRCDGATSPSC